MFANAEVEVAPTVIVRLEVASAIERQARLRGRGKVGRAAHQPGNILRQNVQNLSRSIAPGHTFRIRGKWLQAFVPTGGQTAVLHLIELIGEVRILRPVLLEELHPRIPQFSPTFSDAVAEVLADALRN